MLFNVVVFILVLGFLIFIHELGHYLAARHVGVKVEQFSIGFPPKAWGKKVGETEYLISWLPLGGYVRLFGQNVEDEDPDDPRNYASKTISQRFYILVAGPAMNLIAALLFMPLVYMIGIQQAQFMQEPVVIGHVMEDSFASQVGFQPGDTIQEVNGTSIPSWEEFYFRTEQIKDGNLTFGVERAGESILLEGPYEAYRNSNNRQWLRDVQPIIGGFTPESPAKAAGLEVADQILSIGGTPVQGWYDISLALKKTQPPLPEQPLAKDAAPQDTPQPVPVLLEVSRDGEIFEVELIPYYHAERNAYLIGMSQYTPVVKRSYGVTDSVVLGTERLVSVTIAIGVFLRTVVMGQATMDDIGGPVRIGAFVGDAARTGVGNLFFLMAIISLQLGILNLLPIPALDGGHIFFLGVEKLKGGPLSAAFREKTQLIGFSLLIFLMLFVTYNDILSLTS